jgi:uncharacterized protein (DUF58 family)
MKWFVGALFILFAALVLESGLLAYSMYVLLGVMIVSHFLARSWTGNLSATRECNRETAEVGETIAVLVKVQNNGWLVIPWLLIEDLLPARSLAGATARLKVKKKRMKIAMLPPKGTSTMLYQIDFKMRGYYQIGPLVLESGDLFGLQRRFVVGTSPHFVLVYPRVIPLEGYDLASRRPIGEVRMTHRLFEDPTRIAGVREYQPGDSLNRIHWGATAKTAMLHSKVYEPSTIAGLTLLLDCHTAGYHDRGEPFRSELAVTTAASLAHAVYSMGQQVGLVTNGRDAADRIRREGWAHDYRSRDAAMQSVAVSEENDRLEPLVVDTRRGAEQFQRILETLARVELTDGLSMSQLIIEATSRLPRDTTLVAILGEASAETAMALGNLRRRGYAVTAVLIIFDDDSCEDAHGRLLAEGVEVRHVKDEAGVSTLCQREMFR